MANIVSVSLPATLTLTMDKLAKSTDQTRSELVRAALREYIADLNEDRGRFLEAYKATRKEKTFSLSTLKSKYSLR